MRGAKFSQVAHQILGIHSKNLKYTIHRKRELHCPKHRIQLIGWGGGVAICLRGQVLPGIRRTIKCNPGKFISLQLSSTLCKQGTPRGLWGTNLQGTHEKGSDFVSCFVLHLIVFACFCTSLFAYFECEGYGRVCTTRDPRERLNGPHGTTRGL